MRLKIHGTKPPLELNAYVQIVMQIQQKIPYGSVGEDCHSSAMFWFGPFKFDKCWARSS